MQKAFTLFISILVVVALNGQSSSRFSYQAVIRNTSNQLVANQTVGMRISILQGSVNGWSIYTQTLFTTTNENGLVSIEIGSGYDLAYINWSDGPYFLKTETDPTGGTSYSITGTSQLLSVPYAFHAKTAESLSGGIWETDPVFTSWDRSSGITITESQVVNLRPYLLSENQSLADVANINNAVNSQIKNLSEPTEPNDAVNKAYVDLLQGQIQALYTRIELLENGGVATTPSVTTTEIANITSSSAKTGGNVQSGGGDPVIARGVVYGIAENPTIEEHLGMTSNGIGTGTFTSLLTGLSPLTTYYVRAYATNSIGTSYGELKVFTTTDINPGVVEIRPGPADGKVARLHEFDPNVNMGNTVDFITYYWTFGGTPAAGISLVEFDISVVPQNATIVQATLSLYHNPTSPSAGHSGENASYLRRVNTPWNQYEVTWNTMPSFTEEGKVLLQSSESETQNYLSIDITHFVALWHQNPSTNNGISIEVIERQLYKSMKFASCNVSDENIRPKLTISYE